MTININRLVQNAAKNEIPIKDAVFEQVEKVHKYLIAFNDILCDMIKYHMVPIYDAGFIESSKQYLTIGINGLVEGAEFLGIKISPNKEYEDYVNSIFETIYELNKRDRTKDIMFNTELVPAENLGVKNAKWDARDGYFVPRDCYNSYIYKVEDDKTNILDKFILQGEKYTGKLDGGVALHLNLEEHLTKDQYLILMQNAIKTGCSYFTYNIPNTICNSCGNISKHKLKKCPKCQSEDLDYATRIIGYLKRVSAFSEARQTEESKRVYH
jgi:ribonucleoside-triphosphate reductase